MRRFFRKCGLIVTLIILTSSLYPQENNDIFDIILFEHPSYKKNFSLLSVYIKESYSNLEFFKKDTVFEASYEFSVELYSKEPVLSKEEYWTETIQVENYGLTNSKENFISKFFEFTLKPAEYDFVFEAKNLNTNRIIQKKEKIKVKSYWDNDYLITDIVCFEGRTLSEEDFHFYKNLEDMKAKYSKGLTFYSEFFIKNIPDKRIARWEISPVYSPDNVIINGNDTLTFDEKRIDKLEIFISPAKLESGKYKLKIQTDNTEKENVFNFMWIDAPIKAIKLPECIEYMKYILDDEEKKKLLALSGEKQRKEFLNYWKNLESSEGNDNKLMKEYFYRVNYANMKFTNRIMPGWETDRGRIYITIGEPDKIDTRKSITSEETYKIWDYSEIARRYIFADRYGDGNYKLIKIVTPQGDITF